MANNTQHDPKVQSLMGRPVTFDLIRLSDEGGVSGTGHVAEGAVFADGTAVMRWLTEKRSTATYDSARDLLAIHGHGGKTQLRYHAIGSVVGYPGFDGRACSNCAHPWSAHELDGAAICACGGCNCCLMEHPEFKPIGERRDPRNFLGDTTP